MIVPEWPQRGLEIPRAGGATTDCFVHRLGGFVVRRLAMITSGIFVAFLGVLHCINQRDQRTDSEAQDSNNAEGKNAHGGRGR